MPTRSVERFLTLDIVRGILIVLMVIGHTVFFAYRGTSATIISLNHLANFLCFTGFLLISGFVSYLAYLHHLHPTQDVRRRLFKRLIVYLLGYYLLASLGLLATHSLNSAHFLGVITFTYLVPFTEFIPAFLLFSGLTLLCRTPLTKMSQTVGRVFFSGLVSYFLGLFFYRYPIAFLPNGWQALLFGKPGWYSFPLFFYLPIFLIGIYLAQRVLQYRSTRHTQRLFIYLSLVSFTWVIGAVGAASLLHQPLSQTFSRWPPTPAFMAVGLAGVALLLFIAYTLSLTHQLKTLRNWFILFGQNAFAIYLCQTGILFVYSIFRFPTVTSAILLGVLISIFIWLSLYLAKILPLNYQFGLTFMAVVEDAKITPQEQHRLSRLSHHLANRLINLPDLFSLQLGTRRVKLIRTSSLIFLTVLIFLTATQVGVSEEYLLLSQSLPNLQGTTNKTWYLPSDSDLTYSISLPQGLFSYWSSQPGQLAVDDSQVYPLAISGQTATATIPLDSIQYGPHTLRAQFTLKQKTFTTKPSSIVYSAPLYVTWTIDWEGYDVPAPFLEGLTQTSAKYSLPMTQLFNPRIYTSADILPTRADQLTAWVIDRVQNNQDEIGLHLHMFPDLVALSGVEPKLEPVWGGNLPGYDVLTTAYSYADMVNILSSAKTLFTDHGLPTPTSYRAGAWFANLDTLQALQDTGFLVDSSGRTAYHFGTHNIPGPWTLTTTTQPYFPSLLDQNHALPPPNLKLLEVPNNGADDFAFTAADMIARFDQNFDQTPLTSPKQVTFLSHPQWYDVRRQQKMDQVFSYIDRFLASKGTGPVVYATLNDVYQAFAHR